MGSCISSKYRSLEEELRDVELPQNPDSPGEHTLQRETRELLRRRRPSRQDGFQDEK